MKSRLFIVAAVTVLAAITASCGDDDTTETTAATTTTAGTSTTAGATTVPSGGDTAVITISSFQFEAAETEIDAGGTVTFVWLSGTHTTTSVDGLWASGGKSAGETFEVTLANPGTFEFFCEFHASMRGTITVNG